MDARQYLKEFSQKLETYQEKFFSQKIKEAMSVDSFVVEALINLKNYMAGGKKARAALTALGYQIAGGKDLKKILPASFSVELAHNALLIHDDFIDHDTLRRSKPTIHTLYGQKMGDHCGASVAITIGDLATFLSIQLIAASGFGAERVNRAVSHFTRFLVNTGYGQLLDIQGGDVIKTRILKTAHYTFVMPLVVGASLAGAGERLLKLLAKYGEPVGLAFQIHDDELGIFGSSKRTGKSTDSDIREGKKTLLFSEALKLAPAKDRIFLQRYYGHIQNNTQITRMKKIIKMSGALAMSRKTARAYVEDGKSFIPRITQNSDLQGTLASLADYMILRGK